MGKSIIETAKKCILNVAVILTVGVMISGVCGMNVKAYDNLTVVIDPGHGGPLTGEENDPNAGASYNDLYEKDMNLITAKALKNELEQYGNVTVYLTRDTDKEMSLKERAQFASSVDADVMLSIHYNASEDHNLFGSEAFVSAFGECYSTGRGIAGYIMKEWSEYGNMLKAVKTRLNDAGSDYYGVIREGTQLNIPVIILEHGYIDNDRDFYRLNTEQAWTQMGICDATGIAKYYGLEKNLVKEKIGPTVTIDLPEKVMEPDTTPPTMVELVIEKYDYDNGDIEFSLKAFDDESKLMYYGFEKKEADEDTVFKQLEPWNGESGVVRGTYHVGVGYQGPITAKVFNVYNDGTLSGSVMLKMNDDEAEKSGSDASVSDKKDTESKKDSKDSKTEDSKEKEKTKDKDKTQDKDQDSDKDTDKDTDKSKDKSKDTKDTGDEDSETAESVKKGDKSEADASKSKDDKETADEEMPDEAKDETEKSESEKTDREKSDIVKTDKDEDVVSEKDVLQTQSEETNTEKKLEEESTVSISLKKLSITGIVAGAVLVIILIGVLIKAVIRVETRKAIREDRERKNYKYTDYDKD